MNTEKLLEKAKIVIMMRPDIVHFCEAIFELEQVIDDSVGTACTDGRKITYSSKFVAEQDKHQLAGLIIHEVLHVILMHMIRIKAMQVKYPRLSHLAHNVAADCEVNCLLRKWGVSLPDGGTEACDMGFPPDLTYEQYCALIDEKFPEGEGLPGPAPGEFEPSDSDLSGEKDAQLEDNVGKLVNRIVQQSQKAGRGSGEMAKYFGIMTAPKFNWKHLLRDFIQEVMGHGDETFSRINRMWSTDEFVLPGYEDEELGKMAILQDTSGSFIYSEAQDSWAYIKQLKEELSFPAIVIQHDTEVVKVDEYDEHETEIEIKSYGGGGTDHSAALEEAEKHNPIGIICFTDLYTRYPDKPPSVPVLWMTYEKDFQQPPFGRVVVMERAVRQ